ncbi:hypothetical protein ILYODFUR_033454 [Ilyodon furcidens]|uniref:Uncharacterized protein n=1 Tax=Ilyodon furcidens TaxID=33524 RepID=A0ABV0TNY8_9TELE
MQLLFCSHHEKSLCLRGTLRRPSCSSPQAMQGAQQTCGRRCSGQMKPKLNSLDANSMCGGETYLCTSHYDMVKHGSASIMQCRSFFFKAETEELARDDGQMLY